VSPSPSITASQRWQRFSEAALRFFHVYGNWLVGISWMRFFVLAILLIVAAAILQSLPPFSYRTTTEVSESAVKKAKKQPVIKIEKPGTPASAGKGLDVSISIDENGVRITPRPRSAASAPAAASAASAAASAAASTGGVSIGPQGIDIRVPAGSDSEEVRQAIREARDAIKEAIDDATEAARDAAEAKAQVVVADNGTRVRTITVHTDVLTNLALVWIAASAIMKITYKGRIQAEVKAAQATETAEAESLKRQVVEARMAAMQAQVEPHFLFNTLASIDHLIETDPPRASQMQKNLIALLRASMPTMREANAQGMRDLGREIAVIRPYLEILKVRMEERLQTEVRVSEGLMSAQFPPMMLSLVENAIKHGLEPKAEGGSLVVSAEVAHGKLVVKVADTGLGFGKAATAGTGIGLNNIRERLQLLYGNRAKLQITENQPSGTVVAIEVPYQTHDQKENA